MHLFTRRDQREYRELTDRLARAEAEASYLRGLVKQANIKVVELQSIIGNNE
jgi:hypothetical protein